MLTYIAVFFGGAFLGQLVLLFFMGASQLSNKRRVFGHLADKGV